MVFFFVVVVCSFHGTYTIGTGVKKNIYFFLFICLNFKSMKAFFFSKNIERSMRGGAHNLYILYLPGGHLHSYENVFDCRQVPPFRHGDGAHGMYFDSQLLPV